MYQARGVDGSAWGANRVLNAEHHWKGVVMTKVSSGGIWRGNTLRAAAVASSLIAFTACGGGGNGGIGGGGGSISGQVSGPTGTNLNQTVVAAFVCTNACQAETDVTDTVAGRTVISSTSARSDYQLPNVPTGKYFVVALQDTNGSGAIDTGDLFGAVSGVPSPAANVNITLQPATINAADALSPAMLEQLRLLER